MPLAALATTLTLGCNTGVDDVQEARTDVQETQQDADQMVADADQDANEEYHETRKVVLDDVQDAKNDVSEDAKNRLANRQDER